MRRQRERKEGDLLAQVNDYTSFCFCRMTSCRNPFHDSLLSSPLPSFHLPLFSALLILYLHVIRVTSRDAFFPAPSIFSIPSSPVFFVFLLLSVFFHKSCTDSRKICSCRDKDPLWLLYAELSLSFLAACLSLVVSISSLSSVKSLTAQPFSLAPVSVSLSSSLPALCHSPLSLPFTNQYAGQQAV